MWQELLGVKKWLNIQRVRTPSLFPIQTRGCKWNYPSYQQMNCRRRFTETQMWPRLILAARISLPLPVRQRPYSEASMYWQLTPGTYWRREDADILIVHEQTVLRLNAASARLFDMLLGCQAIPTCETVEAAVLIQLLVGEGILSSALTSSNYTGARLWHFPAPAG